MKRTTAYRTSYAVELTVKQFTKVEERDDKAKDFGLLSILSNLGAHSIEYNGHFGASIFYTLDTETDSPELRAEIETAIVDYANGKRRTF